jgi:hypothetical protein
VFFKWNPVKLIKVTHERETDLLVRIMRIIAQMSNAFEYMLYFSPVYVVNPVDENVVQDIYDSSGSDAVGIIRHDKEVHRGEKVIWAKENIMGNLVFFTSSFGQ